MKIVILPGLDGTGELLADVEELLMPEHTVMIIRYPSDLQTYKEIQEWIECKLPHDDYLIVAESFAGPLAIMISSKKPIGLKGVAFVASFTRTPMKLPLLLTYAAKIMPFRSHWLTWLAQPLLMGKWSNKNFRKKLRHALILVPAATLAGRLREILRADVTGALGQLTVPIIYLMATHDRLVPSRMSLDFQISPGVVSSIEGPHFLLQANAHQAAEHISQFAKSLW